MKKEDTNDAIIKKEPVNVETIKHRIYEVRGMRVMLDRDLAELYGVETRALNQAVKRNMERFPKDFMFQITRKELHSLRLQHFTENEFDINLRSQIVTSSLEHIGTQEDIDNSENNIPSNWGGSRRMPFVFTEHGAIMLASVLHSPLAVQMSVLVTRAFIAMRNALTGMISMNLKMEQLSHKVDALSSRVDEMLREQNEHNTELAVQIDAINDALDQLREPPEKPRKRIGFRTKNEVNSDEE